MIRIGIDVGGTNTDGVVLSSANQVLATAKTATTEDVTEGISSTLDALRQETISNGITKNESVSTVIVGTTHFINAIVQRRDLAPVGILRIGHPASRSIAPFSGWPADLVEKVRGRIWNIEGGHEFDGSIFAKLDERAIQSAAEEIADLGLGTIVVSSVFSPVNPEHEMIARDILANTVPHADITLSSDLGRIGLLQRENVALLNATLIPLARRVCQAVVLATRANGIETPVYFSQNDGTIASLESVVRQPIYCFASGATNSIRGAALLADVKDAIVADVGGTTTDVGLVQNGLPNETNTVFRIGGVPTMFRVPDVLSVGLGGGTIIHENDRRYGPESAGYSLTTRARVFGGDVLTATDLAALQGLTSLGNRELVSNVSRQLVADFTEHCRSLIADTIDKVKIRAGALPLVAVGGGAFLVPDDIEGASHVMRPKHGECANAIGAAMSQVSGEVDQIFHNVPRAQAIGTAKEIARERAAAAGAKASSVSIAEIDEVPLAYLPGNALRVRVKAIGEMVFEA
ncbi:hydantoinase/oxoprolinase N-terminal domain-containing protein [Stappia sp.]|uniref:hydantoinase/oxoprolinase N-terminal domain-containing protein n=1 Tax=Stappia sp. TaxID=1870903 RepID=UPI003A993A8F